MTGQTINTSFLSTEDAVFQIKSLADSIKVKQNSDLSFLSIRQEAYKDEKLVLGFSKFDESIIEKFNLNFSRYYHEKRNDTPKLLETSIFFQDYHEGKAIFERIPDERLLEALEYLEELNRRSRNTAELGIKARAVVAGTFATIASILVPPVAAVVGTVGALAIGAGVGVGTYVSKDKILENWDERSKSITRLKTKIEEYNKEMKKKEDEISKEKTLSKAIQTGVKNGLETQTQTTTDAVKQMNTDIVVNQGVQHTI